MNLWSQSLFARWIFIKAIFCKMKKIFHYFWNLTENFSKISEKVWIVLGQRPSWRQMEFHLSIFLGEAQSSSLQAQCVLKASWTGNFSWNYCIKWTASIGLFCASSKNLKNSSHNARWNSSFLITKSFQEYQGWLSWWISCLFERFICLYFETFWKWWSVCIFKGKDINGIEGFLRPPEIVSAYRTP
jgi:hypothetical protein